MRCSDGRHLMDRSLLTWTLRSGSFWRMQFPLSLSFKKVALAPQIFVRDASGNDIAYVKQKLFKLKEHVEVFRDKSKTELLYEIRANKVLDFSAAYSFVNAAGQALGLVRRKGMKSLWKARYEVDSRGDGNVDLLIEEENGWVKVMDAIFGEIPILGMFTGLLFNPSYTLTDTSTGELLMRVKKQASFFESEFQIENVANVDHARSAQMLLSIMMMTLLERSRG